MIVQVDHFQTFDHVYVRSTRIAEIAYPTNYSGLSMAGYDGVTIVSACILC